MGSWTFAPCVGCFGGAETYGLPAGSGGETRFRIDSYSKSEAEVADEDRFAGNVERLNDSLRGEVNGGILDGGDFLHPKPHGGSGQSGCEVCQGSSQVCKAVLKPAANHRFWNHTQAVEQELCHLA